MDDLLINFADQSIESPSEEEEGYKYHFTNGSPAGSEHAVQVGPAAAAPAASNHDDPFPHNEASSIQKGTSSGAEDEANYNADIDDDDDDDYGREEATYTDVHFSSFHNKDYNAPQTHDVQRGATNGNVKRSSGSSNQGQNGLDDIGQHLRRLHRQDAERDEILTVRALQQASSRPCNMLTELNSNSIKRM